jgi:hypothetical protein
VSPEAAAQPTGPEQYLTDVLNWRPPIPYGFADISALAKQAKSIEAGEPGYAWERLPLWLAKVEETYEGIGKLPIVTLDIGSSVPLYAQYLRTYEFMRDGVRARELSNVLFDDTALRLLQKKDKRFKPLTLVAARDEASKLLLESALQEFLYTSAPGDIDPSTGRYDELAENLFERLMSQRYTFSEERTGTHREDSRGLRVIKTEDSQSYFQRISNLPVPSTRALQARQTLAVYKDSEESRALAGETEPVGEELAERLIKEQARMLAYTLKHNSRRYRPARFLSFDSSDPAEIALSSLINMPESTRSLELFSHAVNSLGERRQHVTGSIFETLPFPDNSLALITCFDAWPFHFQTDPGTHGVNANFKEVAVNTLQNMYEKLAYGGRLVIFPWAIKRGSYEETLGDTLMFRAVEKEFALRTGVRHGVGTELFPAEVLMDWMSVSDRQTAEDMSPIFESQDDAFDVLTIKKPSASSVKAHASHIGKMATRAGNPD